MKNSIVKELRHVTRPRHVFKDTGFILIASAVIAVWMYAIDSGVGQLIKIIF